jgi:hypothetical protein
MRWILVRGRDWRGEAPSRKDPWHSFGTRRILGVAPLNTLTPSSLSLTFHLIEFTNHDHVLFKCHGVPLSTLSRCILRQFASFPSSFVFSVSASCKDTIAGILGLGCRLFV